jgi:hypothetical protein
MQFKSKTTKPDALKSVSCGLKREEEVGITYGAFNTGQEKKDESAELIEQEQTVRCVMSCIPRKKWMGC